MLKVQTAIEKARIYTGASDKALANATLLIRGERLEYVGPHSKRPDYEAEQVIDGRELVVLPGLIDLHVHALINEATLASFLQNGVTAVRDLASDPFHALEWKAREQTGLILSPRIFSSGPVLTCPKGYPENVWGPQLAMKLTGRYQAQEKVRQLAGLGMDLIKLGLEHELGPCLSQTEVDAAVEAAHGLGKRVTAHITDDRDFECCVAAGVDEVAHMPARPISDDLWKEAIRRKIKIVPTLHAHAGWAEEWQRRADHPFGLHCQHGFHQGHRQCLKNTERFLSLGGKLVYGTDAGNPHMPFGISVREWKDLQSAGIRPLQCLKMATLEAAKVLGIEEEAGSLEKGKWADLGLYRYDPLENPQNFRTIQWVFKGGQKIPVGPLEFPKPFDLDYWIRQWERTKFELKAWDEP